MSYTLHVEGMHCPSCEKMVLMMIKDIDGVKVEFVSHQTGEVIVECDATMLPTVKKAIANAGYIVTN